MSLPSRERGLKFSTVRAFFRTTLVAPFAGAWIEIYVLATCNNCCLVAPFAGAWIEIVHTNMVLDNVASVAPFAGAWIEIDMPITEITGGMVAPFAGAWIEILLKQVFSVRRKSLPSRERGLKLQCYDFDGEPNSRSLRGSVD